MPKIDRDVDEFGRTELHYVPVDLPVDMQTEEITRLIQDGYDPNLQDKNGWSPLHFAAQEWSEPAAKALLATGASVDARDAYGNTPLWRATFASEGRGELIRLLLEAGADPDCENYSGVSPRSLASTIGNYNVVQYYEEKA